MSDSIDRRTFLGQVARTAAAGAVMSGLPGLAAETRPSSTQPALEWRNKQPTMTYAKLGRTNFMVSRCVFGAGGVYKNRGDLRLLEIAIERGLNYIDTGRWYTNSESTIAGLLAKNRDKLWVVSKAAYIGWPTMTIKQGEDAKAAKVFTDQLEESLRQLKTDTIDCYMVQGAEHDWVVTMDSLYEAFDKARKAGKVRYFGLATHANLPKVCELAAKSGRYDVVMLTVNPNSLKELAPSIKALRDAGVGVVSIKATASIGEKPKVYDGVYGEMFAGQELSPYQRAFAYLLFRGNVDAFNSHTPDRQTLEANLAVPTLKLAQAELDRLERRVLADCRGACHYCGRCMRACPEGIRVSDMLRCHAYLHVYGDRSLAQATYDGRAKDRAPRCRQCGACRDACPESIDLPAIVASVRAELA